MKVVALVSGGKDSCYAMQRCIDYGHEIVALANLLPVDDAVDELDSFMFQTVGHQMVGSIAQCMGLPLFRRRIQGTARLQDLRYRKTMGDEVEDLEKLLQAVKEKFPEVGAVSSGAIASDYQRLRVESVCSGLGLISLAYLWKQDQALLLQHMIDSGIHAVLVKVAAIGMDPHKHLGKDLATLQSHFTRLRSMYGSNICGEGGEYESLTLDSPLFKHARIILDKFEVTLHSPDQIAPVGVLHPTKFHLEAKSPAVKGSLEYSSLIFEVNDETGSHEDNFRIGKHVATNELVGGRMYDKVHACTISQQHGSFTMGCWRQLDGENITLTTELSILLSATESELQRKGLSWGNVTYVRLFLQDIADFGQANEVYVQHITEQKCERGVPSRCCMQVCLFESHMGSAMVEVMASSDLSKKILHVQSISCWAPSCIGPYSQATLSGNILHMAGQIGLDPPTMTLVPGGAATEMKQALHNCEAVARAFDASLSRAATNFTIYCSEIAGRIGLQQVEEKLQDFLSTVDENCEAGEERGPSLQYSETSSAVPSPLVLYVLVPALPKGAQVEVEPSAFVLDSSRRCYSSDEDSFESGSRGWQTFHIEPSILITKGEAQSNSHLLLSEIKQTHSLIRSTCESLILPTRLCRALVWIGGASSGSGVRDLPEEFKHMQLEEKDLERTLRQAIEALFEVLQRAGLCWSEVTAFRIYFDAKAISVADLRGAMKDVRDNHLQNISDVRKMIPDATFIPVSRVGRTSAMQELVAIDLTAVSAKQL